MSTLSRVILWVAVVLAVGLLPGCGKRETGRTVVRVAVWSNDVEEKAMRASLAKFEKLHPNIKVELEIATWDRLSWKVMVSTAGGRPPDISRVSSEWYVPLAAKGLLEPLDPFIKRDNWDIWDFYPEAIEGWGKYNGKVYTIPGDVDVEALYYNKTMFDKAGVPYPDWAWDHNTYLAAAKKLTKDLDGDGKTDQWGASIAFWQLFVYENGGSIVSDDMNTCTLDQPAAYEGIQRMADLVNKYHVAPTREESTGQGNWKMFTSGKIGMMIGGSYAAKLVFEKEVKDFEYDAGPVPKGPKARCTFIGGAAWSMISRSKHKDEAWEVLKWLTSKDYQTDQVNLNSQVPTRKSLAESPVFLTKDQPPKNRQVFLDMIKYGRATPHVSCYAEMNQIIGSELDLVMLGKQSAKEACLKIKPRLDQLLRHRDR